MIVGIAALFVMLFGGGAALGLLGDAIEDHVDEPARVERANEILAQAQKAIESKQGKIADIRRDITVLDKRYDTTEQEYLAQYQRLDKAWEELHRKLLDARFELKETLTKAEWEAAFAQYQNKS